MENLVWGVGIQCVLILFPLVFILFVGLRTVEKDKYALVFRLGHFAGVRGPGWFFIIPGIDKLMTVDMLNVPSQDYMTKDNIMSHINMKLYYQIIDPVKAISQMQNYKQELLQMAETTLCTVVEDVELAELVSERERINTNLKNIINQETDPLGVRVSLVEIDYD